MSSKEPDNNERSNVAQKPVEAPSNSGQDCCTGSKSLITVDEESSRTTALSAAAVSWKQNLNYLRRRECDSGDNVELLSRGMKELHMGVLRGIVWWIQEAEQTAILEAAQKQLPDDWPRNYAFAYLLSIAGTILPLLCIFTSLPALVLAPIEWWPLSPARMLHLYDMVQISMYQNTLFGKRRIMSKLGSQRLAQAAQLEGFGKMLPA